MEPFTLDDSKQLLKAALAAASDLSSRKPAREVSLAITKMQEALHWLNELEEMDE